MELDKKHILIVDDETSICEVVGQYLKKEGYVVLTASSGEEALEILRTHSIQMVISDIKMGGMSGVELLKHIKENGRMIPVLMTTGYPTLDTAIEALKLGAFDYMTKPFHLEEIGEKVKRAFNMLKIQEENLLFSRLVSLHEITKVITSTIDLNELNYKFLDFSIQILKADGGALLLMDHTNRLAITETMGEKFLPDYWLNPTFVTTSKLVAHYQNPLIIDQGKAPIYKEIPPLPQEISSFICFPLKTAARVIGVLNLVRIRGREPFSGLDLEIINVLSSQASISMENVRLYNNIRDNYLKTIRAFALAVEAKDEYTHGHSENVMKYTVILAKHLGLPDSEIEYVKYAGLLHDIGKIGVSEYILNKTSRLTEKEFEEIKKHIPFGARILSVADAFEAMTSDRPYRKSLDTETAFTILHNERGKQFDPHIVDVFVKIMSGISQK